VWAGRMRVAQQEVRRLGSIEHARVAVDRVAKFQPWRKPRNVRAAARREYLARPLELTGSVWERASAVVRTGFTDPDLALCVDDMGKTAGDFPNSVRIREAIAESQKWLRTARTALGVGILTGVLPPALDAIPVIDGKQPWTWYKNENIHQVGSTW
jgi:hypothetical protein